jgi:tetratricopeptide (TPR) repeat protein
MTELAIRGNSGRRAGSAVASNDLMAFDDVQLYFDEPAAPGTEELLAEAAASYGEDTAEFALLRAYFLAPRQLGVLVALYRYYFYQHRLDDALRTAERAMAVSGDRLALAHEWHGLRPEGIGEAATQSIGLLRFYLLALKASAIVLLRMGQRDEGCRRLTKLAELDPQDRLGAAALLRVPGVDPSAAASEAVN